MESGAWLGILLAGMSAFFLQSWPAIAQEAPCHEDGPHYGNWSALSCGSLSNAPSISPTQIGQKYGDALIVLTNVAPTPVYSQGSEYRSVAWDCPPSTNYETNSITYTYTAGSVFWTTNSPPAPWNLPGTFTNSFTATAYIVGQSSDTNVCPNLTNTIATVSWCAITNSTNSTPGSMVLTNATINPASGAVGTSFSASAIQMTNNAVVVVTTNCACDSSFNGTSTTNPPPIVLSNWWVATVGTFSTNGTGTNTQTPFTPTDGGIGSVTFYANYTDGCDTNLQMASNSCALWVSTNSTNCVTNGGVGLANTSTNTNFCFGTQVTLSATNLVTNAVLMVTTNCPWNTNLNTSWTTNVVPTIISNWWTITGPGTSYTNYGTGLSTGSLSPLPTNGGMGTATFYVSYTTWTNTTNSLPSYCTNTNSVQVPFNVIQISNWCVATVPANQTRTTIGVGEQVNLVLVGSPPGTFTWTNVGTNSLGTNLSGSLALTTSPTNAFTAPSNASTVNVTVSYAGGSNTLTFAVLEPIGVTHSDLRGLVSGTGYFTTGQVGAGIITTPYFTPTNVSFARLYGLEVGLNATNVNGYYTNFSTNQLAHGNNGANQWFSIMPDNSWFHTNGQYSWDYAWDGGYANPGYGGGYTWIIPGQWKVGTNGTTNNFSTNASWSQTVTLATNGNGDMTVTKFGWSVTRGTNGAYITNSTGP